MQFSIINSNMKPDVFHYIVLLIASRSVSYDALCTDVYKAAVSHALAYEYIVGCMRTKPVNL